MLKKFSIPLFALLILTGISCEQAQTNEFDNSGNNNQTEEQTNSANEKDSMEQEEANTPSKEGPVAVMKTNYGDIRVQLFKEETPKTVENFVSLAQDDFYDGTLFHRVIPDFMIQGGDPNTREYPDDWSTHGRGGPGYTFDDEFNDFKNIRGRISMANSGPDTNGSQFFLITAEETPWLDGKHAVFGEVVEGMDVVDEIERVETNERDHPVEDVRIEDVVIEEEGG